jgi:colicin import membrane protein
MRDQVIQQTSGRPRRSVSGVFVGRSGSATTAATVTGLISTPPSADLDSVAGWEFIRDQQRARHPGTQIVGWYRGEPRGALAVSFRDIRLHDKSFRRPDGFGLLLGLEQGGREKLLMRSGGHLVEVAVRGTGQPGWRDLEWRPPGTAADGFTPRTPFGEPGEAVATTEAALAAMTAGKRHRPAAATPFRNEPVAPARGPAMSAQPVVPPIPVRPAKQPQPVAQSTLDAGLGERLHVPTSKRRAATSAPKIARPSRARGAWTAVRSSKENLGVVGSSLALLGAISFALLTSNPSTSSAGEQSATERLLSEPAAVASATGVGARQIAAKREADRADQLAAERRQARRAREARRAERRQAERRAAQRRAASRAKAAATAAAAKPAAPRVSATTRAATPVYTPPASSNSGPSTSSSGGPSSSPGQTDSGSGGSGSNPGNGSDVAVAPPSQ